MADIAPFYLPLDYLIGLLVWILFLGWSCIWCLRRRQHLKRSRRRLSGVNLLLSLWMLCGVLTLGELWCAFLIDQSDAFNMTNISKRWFRKYIESQRNQAGWRDRREFSRTVPEGVKRICFLGDSFTIGHGIRRREDRFSDLVEGSLERTRPGEFQVANLGDPGLETSQIEAIVKSTLDQGYQIDMAIYVFMLNDIEGYDPRTQEVIKTLQQVEPRFFLVSKTYFFNWLYFRFRQATGPGSNYFPHLVESYVTTPWDGLRRKLVELKSDCLTQNVDFRMVIFPFLQNLGPGYPFHDAHLRLVKFCREEHIPCLDLEPVLSRHAAETLTVNRFDAHPNERAHAIVAKALEETLLKDLFDGDVEKAGNHQDGNAGSSSELERSR